MDFRKLTIDFSWLNYNFSRSFSLVSPLFSCWMCRCPKIHQNTMFNLTHPFFLFIAHIKSNCICFHCHCQCRCQFVTFHNLWYEKCVTDFNFYVLLSVIIVVEVGTKSPRIQSHQACVLFFFFFASILHFFLFRWLCSKSKMSLCVSPNEMKWKMKTIEMKCGKNWRELGNI